jgi:hypothetical protein
MQKMIDFLLFVKKLIKKSYKSFSVHILQNTVGSTFLSEFTSVPYRTGRDRLSF